MMQIRSFKAEIRQRPQPTLWSETRHGNRLDCETAVLLRQVVTPIFDAATSWRALREALRAEGYDMAFERGRLVLIETETRGKICSCRFLGHPLPSLVARFGKLRARAPRRGGHYGQAVI